jgi:hypothetical protein
MVIFNSDLRFISLIPAFLIKSLSKLGHWIKLQQNYIIVVIDAPACHR